MARTPATFPDGTRVTDFVSLGVVTSRFPLQTVKCILDDTGTASKRHRALPAHVVVYYVIALALFMQVSYCEVLRCLLEGLQWLRFPGIRIPVAGKSGISKARARLGIEPVKQLHDQVVKPIASKDTKGAWYRQWRLVSLDGSTLDVADTEENNRKFGRPGSSRGDSAFPQMRFVSLVENGTHVLFGSAWGKYCQQEITLTDDVLPSLERGMLCLADRNFYSYKLWNKARATGADLLWRVKRNMRLDPIKLFADGSYLANVYPSSKDRRYGTNGVAVRVIEYRLKDVPGSESAYRLITTILDSEAAPASELAVEYHERWEVESAFDELKTHLRGARIILRSKTPDLVVQEFYGLMMAHFAVRGLMHEAAMKAGIDADKLSFVHTVRVIRRKLPLCHSFPPSALETIPSGGLGGDSRRKGREQPRQAKQTRCQAQDEQLSHQNQG